MVRAASVSTDVATLRLPAVLLCGASYHRCPSGTVWTDPLPTMSPPLAGMSIGKQIRSAETSKIPVMCVIGGREAESGTLAVRTYRDGEVRCGRLESVGFADGGGGRVE